PSLSSLYYSLSFFCRSPFSFSTHTAPTPIYTLSLHDALPIYTGYDELSLTSLSTSDHSRLEDILDALNSWAEADHVSLSLPSLRDRKSTRLNSSHVSISYAVFCLKKKSTSKTWETGAAER